MELSSPPKPFLGVRFALVGFNPVDQNKLQSKLITGGGVDVGRFSQSYTHLIVDKLIYDDPICVAARNSGKVVVLGSWVDHSFNVGALVDANSVMYRPPKDLNGIPGAESLIVCLTGYQRHDRDDIMSMVALMGGQFSKPLVANKITHLICYKFEGDKYELAKRIKRIKIVNHRWLEDCLKAWQLLPEADYGISGYELEMMEASAKDSEDEAEDASTKRANKSPLGLRVIVAVDGSMPKSVELNAPVVQAKTGAQADSSSTITSKDVWLTPKKVDRPHETMASIDAGLPLQHDSGKPRTFQDAFHDALADPFDKKSVSREVKDDLMSGSKNTERFSPMAPLQHDCSKTSTFQDTSHDKTSGTREVMSMFNPLDKTPGSRDGKDDLTSISKSTERFPSLAMKLSSKYQWDESSIRNSSPGTNNGGLKAITSSDISASKSNYAAEGTSGREDACKIDKLHEKESPQKRSTGGYASSSKSQKVGGGGEPIGVLTASLFLPEQSHISVSSNSCPNEGGEVAQKSPVSNSTTKSLSSNVVDRKYAILTSEGELAETIAKKTPERSLTELAMEKSNTMSGLDDLGKSDKPDTEQPKKKTASRKTLGTRPKIRNSSKKMGSLYLSKTVLSNDRTNCLSKGEVATPMLEDGNQKETSVPAINSESTPKVAQQVDSKGITFEKIDCTDGDTNPPAEKVNHELDADVNQQDMLVETEGQRRADAEVEVRTAETEANDGSNEGASDDRNKSKCGKKASGEQINLGNSKKRDSPTAEVGKASIKKTKRARKENVRGNDTELKDRGGNSVEEKENVAVRGNDAEVEIRTAEPELNDGSNEDAPDDTTELVIDRNKSKRGKKASGELINLGNLKKRDLPTAEVGKASIKKTKRSRKENNVRENDRGDNSVEEKENVAVNKKSRKIGGDESLSMGKPPARKETEKSAKTLTKTEKKSEQISSSKSMASRKILHDRGKESACFIVSGPRFQRKEYQQIVRRLKGKACRDSHQWSYQATHFIASEIRRTEKFFAASASGSWILKGDYLPACSQAGKFLPEEPFEWHSTGLSQDGAINLEAPRKWRLVREKTGHGAFYGMRIVIYGDCMVPSLDTLKRAVKSGDGTILATAPPYRRFLNSDTDFAVISPGMPRVDAWIQEFLNHEIPCVLADYLVEYICKPGYPLDKHVLYNTHKWAEQSFNKLQRSSEEEVVEEEVASPSGHSEGDDIACVVCGRSDREEVMLICGDEKNSRGCGIGTHMDCCDPPMARVPEHDWFCPQCSDSTPKKKTRKVKRN
ncbi:PREDICTED: BRCT domain-containing protein At4g02110 [Tarenaya hassleriana]|uniref:BRCT domain-containing protein At4g02110 n=1 Tax=Tarenaya hassleriana TaxID=28532 RepID=UPI00053C5255|nr:PREDICTED: BRCT domain-containing protein At4g02110 [Tarenaya hassleriana]